MPFITHETTTAELYAFYVEGQNYDLDASVSLCRQFVRAARALHAQIVKAKAKSIEIDGVPIEFDARLIERQIADALDWLAVNDSSFGDNTARNGSVTHYDMKGIRE